MNPGRSICRAASVWRMNMLTLLALVSLSVSCGCAKRDEMRFHAGSGDAGGFILQQAIARGGQPLTTNGLPAISGAWRYAEDQYGVVVRMERSDYGTVEKLLGMAFGKPRFGPTETTDGGKLGGYRLTPQGGGIQFGYDAEGAVVIIVRQLSRQEFTEGLTKAMQELQTRETP